MFFFNNISLLVNGFESISWLRGTNKVDKLLSSSFKIWGKSNNFLFNFSNLINVPNIIFALSTIHDQYAHSIQLQHSQFVLD